MYQPNIFLAIDSELGLEDKFTASLHYVIDNVPGVGQGIVDVIAENAWISTSVFCGAEDHPSGTSESKPDFKLACADYDILVEHKLESDLGERQLERYLLLPKGRTTYLALISNRDHSVSEEVIGNTAYLHPRSLQRPHFQWEHFYDVIASRPERLARDFAKYMKKLGMAPAPLVGDWGCLFDDQLISKSFVDHSIDLANYFKGEGARWRARGLGFEVGNPRPWLHLLYIYASKSVRPVVYELDSPYLLARVFVKTSYAEVIDRFSGRRDVFDSNGEPIIGWSLDKPAPWNKEELRLVYECASGLQGYLTPNTVETRERLRDFGRTVFENIARIGEGLM